MVHHVGRDASGVGFVQTVERLLHFRVVLLEQPFDQLEQLRGRARALLLLQEVQFILLLKRGLVSFERRELRRFHNLLGFGIEKALCFSSERG